MKHPAKQQAAPLLRRVLSRNMGAGRLAMYAAAMTLGLAIVMGAVQLWADISRAVSGDDTFLPPGYVIIQKQVNGLASLLGDDSSTAFTEAEVKALRSYSRIEDAAPFEAADYDVFASINLGGRRMSTSLFLEAVPDSLIDGVPPEWESGNYDREVPVIISRDYLALYNFGYAPSRGMPRLSEEMVKMVPLQLTLSSSDGTRRRDVNARIAGFSSRLNTIAVPLDFMRQTNAELGGGRPVTPSRMIVKMRVPDDPAALDWLEAQGYDIAGEQADLGRAAGVARVVAAVIVVVGCIITLLAIGLMALSISLMMERNRGRVRQLVMLGYSRSAIAGFYMRRIALVNCAVVVAATALTLCAAAVWRSALREAGVEGAPVWGAVAVGVVVAVAATALCLPALKRGVR